MTPGDPLFVPGAESHIVAASIGQARKTVFKLLREMFGEDPEGYRISESVNMCEVRHVASNTRVSVMAPSGKTGQGLVRAPLLIADEPGAWQVDGGETLHDAIQTAQGKPGCALKVLYIGTLAPSMGGWWHDLVADGSHGSTFVMALQGASRKRWDSWPVIRACNPLMARFPKSRAKLLEERDAGRVSTRARSRYLSYRLNLPTPEESTVLLTVEEWADLAARPVGACEGRPVVGIDLGGGRAWSAAVAIYASGRVRAVAVAPGIPSVERQEKRDRVARGTYGALVASGQLIVDHGYRVQRVSTLMNAVKAWRPLGAICDFFKLRHLHDCRPLFPVSSRRTRWSNATEDIDALRRLALDGPLSVDPASAALLAASLGAATVMIDPTDRNNKRLVKAGTNNTARDDVAAAFVLASGGHARRPAAPARKRRLIAV